MLKVRTPRDLSAAMRLIGKSDYTSIGSYTIVCVCADGEVMRPSSALATFKAQLAHIRDRDDARIIAVDTFDEGEDEIDCETGEPIASSYGAVEDAS
jgi:hypothetical protein